jgi:hypothetical protein
MDTKCLIAATVAFLLLVPCAIMAQGTPSATLVTALQSARPGAVVPMGTTIGVIGPYNSAAQPVAATGGGTLLYSDDPETAGAAGILYRDTAVPAGVVRVYLYHVNGLQAQHRFSIVLVNNGAGAVLVTPRRKALPPPTGNYLDVGREATRQFYENAQLPPAVTVPAGGRALLDESLDQLRVNRNALANGFYEFSTSGPLEIATVMVAVGTDTLAAYPTMAFSPNDGFDRDGTFSPLTRRNQTVYQYSTTNRMRRVRIGESLTLPQGDPPASGTSAETGQPRRLLGNYGIDYVIDIDVTNPTGEHLAVLLNPRGGTYSGYTRVFWAGELTATKVPAPPTLVIQPTAESGVCAVLPPLAGTVRLTIETTPAGASSLPFDLVLVPFSMPATGHGWMAR